MNERQLDKNAARRLAIIRHAREVTGNVALTCRYYGISRQVFYVWYRRYEAEGLAGLRDRSTRPLHCPHETSSEVVGKIIYLRQNYHFGPAKISMYLKRYHDIEISNSGVWRILKRVDLSRLPASQRYQRHDRKWKRYEKPMPGHAVQVDVKFIAPLSTASKKKYYQFTAIDDCTRVRVLRIYDRLNQKTAIQFADFLLDKFPFRVEAIQTDNGSEFQSAFHWHLMDRGIRHIYIRPATPRLNGKVERSHRIDGEEFYRMLKGVVIDDTQLFNDRLQEWQDFYNYHRPHGASAARHPTNGYGRRPPPQRPPSKRSTSVAHDGTCKSSLTLALPTTIVVRAAPDPGSGTLLSGAWPRPRPTNWAGLWSPVAGRTTKGASMASGAKPARVAGRFAVLDSQTKTSTLFRLAGLSALLAGVCYTLVGIFHPANIPASVTTSTWGTVHVIVCAMSFFGVLGLTGIYARQAVQSGWLGLVGYVMLSFWMVLVMGFSFVEAFVLPQIATATPAFVDGWMKMFNGGTSSISMGALPTLWTLSGPLYILGGLLFGIATFRAGILPRGAAVLLALGTVLAPVAAKLSLSAQPKIAIPTGLALAWLGYALMTERRTSAGEQNDEATA